jgi:hypothetical protein
MKKHAIKKYTRLLLLALALPLMLSMSPAPKLDGRVSMIARITEMGERITVEVIESPYTSGTHIVHTPPETVYLGENGEPISRDALAVGDIVCIRYSGQVMLSYPPQIVAAEIRRMGCQI